MKQCVMWLLIGLLGGACAVQAAYTGPPAMPATAPTRIRVVSDNNYPPYMFVDAAGRLRGYEADIWQLFERHTGIQVDLAVHDWADAQREMLAGRADVIDVIYRTPSRETQYDYSAPYAKLAVYIYADRRIAGVRDVSSLRGFTVGVESGDSCAERLRALGLSELRTYRNYEALVAAAVEGDPRIFCMDESPANYFLYRASALDRFRPAFKLYEGDLHWAVRKGDRAMLDLVSAGMARITPAEREAAYRRWLDRPATLMPYLRDAKLALAVVLGLVALMLLWVWMLRLSVAARTRDLRVEEAKLRALFDASPDGLWVKDRDGAYVACNERTCKLFCVRREQLLGRRDEQLFDALYAQATREFDHEVMSSGQMRTRLVPIPLQNGTVRQFEVVKVPLYAPDGSVRGVLGSARDVTERMELESRLRLWAHAFQHAAFGVAIFDSRHKVISSANPTFARERGYLPEEMVGMPVDALYPPDLVDARRKVRQAIDAQVHSVVETEQITRDGRRFPVQLDCSVLRDADGHPEYVIVYAQDISERLAAESELRLAAAAFQTQEALMVTDAERRIQRVNQAFTTLTGYSGSEAVGRSVSLLRARHHDDAYYERKWQQIAREGVWQGEQWIQVKRGQPRVVRSTFSVVRDAEDRITHYLCSMVDLTAEREAHASLDRMTFFDQLTDLPNRNFLHGQLQHLLDQRPTHGAALLLANLDHFKRVNDLRGHSAGDQLLLLVARRLQALEGDGLLARFSGDTFAWLVDYARPGAGAHLQRVLACAERMRAALNEPFRLGDAIPVSASFSIGWAEVAAGDGGAEAVFKAAELAMFEAKSAGRDQVCGFEPRMLAELERREALVQDLHAALADGGLELHPQLQLDRLGRATGAEMLLRWTRPCGERVGPAVFIPLAEESGLILALGDWVLRETCRQLVAWVRRPGMAHLTLAANVSARQFAQPGFVDGVREVLEATGADPTRLKIEITETAVLSDLDEAAFKLTRLRELGVKISLDDFGTGYSSLAYLTRLPLDQLKIDKSFVDKVPGDGAGTMLVETIIAMGHGLGLEVIAEGVEVAAQQDFLLIHGCDAFQGYLHARPMPLAAFEALLEAHFQPA